MYFIGYDVGSSSLKAALLNAKTGKTVAAAQYPDSEMPIQAKQAGWAEQDPAMWWDACKKATARLIKKAAIDTKKIKGIGISYQVENLSMDSFLDTSTCPHAIVVSFVLDQPI